MNDLRVINLSSYTTPKNCRIQQQRMDSLWRR